ncbi:hypothetical protein EJB05_41908, partial [Eragrostis curvula]
EFAAACGVGAGWLLVLRHRGGGVLTVKVFDDSGCLRELAAQPSGVKVMAEEAAGSAIGEEAIREPAAPAVPEEPTGDAVGSSSGVRSGSHMDEAASNLSFTRTEPQPKMRISFRVPGYTAYLDDGSSPYIEAEDHTTYLTSGIEELPTFTNGGWELPLLKSGVEAIGPTPAGAPIAAAVVATHAPTPAPPSTPAGAPPAPAPAPSASSTVPSPPHSPASATVSRPTKLAVRFSALLRSCCSRPQWRVFIVIVLKVYPPSHFSW